MGASESKQAEGQYIGNHGRQQQHGRDGYAFYGRDEASSAAGPAKPYPRPPPPNQATSRQQVEYWSIADLVNNMKRREQAEKIMQGDDNMIYTNPSIIAAELQQRNQRHPREWFVPDEPEEHKRVGNNHEDEMPLPDWVTANLARAPPDSINDTAHNGELGHVPFGLREPERKTAGFHGEPTDYGDDNEIVYDHLKKRQSRPHDFRTDLGVEMGSVDLTDDYDVIGLIDEAIAGTLNLEDKNDQIPEHTTSSDGGNWATPQLAPTREHPQQFNEQREARNKNGLITAQDEGGNWAIPQMAPPNGHTHIRVTGKEGNSTTVANGGNSAFSKVSPSLKQPTNEPRFNAGERSLGPGNEEKISKQEIYPKRMRANNDTRVSSLNNWMKDKSGTEVPDWFADVGKIQTKKSNAQALSKSTKWPTINSEGIAQTPGFYITPMNNIGRSVNVPNGHMRQNIMAHNRINQVRKMPEQRSQDPYTQVYAAPNPQLLEQMRINNGKSNIRNTHAPPPTIGMYGNIPPTRGVYDDWTATSVLADRMKNLSHGQYEWISASQRMDKQTNGRFINQ